MTSRMISIVEAFQNLAVAIKRAELLDARKAVKSKLNIIYTNNEDRRDWLKQLRELEEMEQALVVMNISY